MSDLKSRVKRIITGSASALISSIEDMAPEMIMEEAIREIELAAEDVRAEHGKEMSSRHLVRLRLEEEQTKHEELQKEIALAAKEGRDDLAEAGIEKQLSIEAQFPILETSIQEHTNNIAELEGFTDALKGKRSEMQADLITFRKENKKVKALESSGQSGDKKITAHVKAEKASNVFDRMLARQANLPSRSETGNAKQLAELSELSRKNKIKERLAQVKALPSAE